MLDSAFLYFFRPPAINRYFWGTPIFRAGNHPHILVHQKIKNPRGPDRSSGPVTKRGCICIASHLLQHGLIPCSGPRGPAMGSTWQMSSPNHDDLFTTLDCWTCVLSLASTKFNCSLLHLYFWWLSPDVLSLSSTKFNHLLIATSLFLMVTPLFLMAKVDGTA